MKHRETEPFYARNTSRNAQVHSAVLLQLLHHYCCPYSADVDRQQSISRANLPRINLIAHTLCLVSFRVPHRCSTPARCHLCSPAQSRMRRPLCLWIGWVRRLGPAIQVCVCMCMILCVHVCMCGWYVLTWHKCSASSSRCFEVRDSSVPLCVLEPAAHSTSLSF